MAGGVRSGGAGVGGGDQQPAAPPTRPHARRSSCWDTLEFRRHLLILFGGGSWGRRGGCWRRLWPPPSS